jgi:hypothetical protein
VRRLPLTLYSTVWYNLGLNDKLGAYARSYQCLQHNFESAVMLKRPS